MSIGWLLLLSQRIPWFFGTLFLGGFALAWINPAPSSRQAVPLPAHALARLKTAGLPGRGDLQFAPDGQSIITAKNTGEVRVWTTSPYSLSVVLKDECQVGAARPAISHDGRLVAFEESPGTVAILEIWTGERRSRLTGNQAHVGAMAFSADDALLAVVDTTGVLLLWETEHGLERARWSTEQHSVERLAFSPNGTTVAAADDGIIVCFEVSTGQRIGVMRGRNYTVNSIAFAGDSRTIASTGLDGTARGTVQLWHIPDGRERILADTQGEWSPMMALALDDRGTLLATGQADRRVKVWDVATGELIRVLEGHTTAIDSLAFSPDAAVLASRDMCGEVLVWSLDSLGSNHDDVFDREPPMPNRSGARTLGEWKEVE